MPGSPEDWGAGLGSIGLSTWDAVAGKTFRNFSMPWFCWSIIPPEGN